MERFECQEGKKKKFRQGWFLAKSLILVNAVCSVQISGSALSLGGNRHIKS